MNGQAGNRLEKKVVSPEYVLDKIKPGQSIFIGTGVAEPRTLIKHLMSTHKGNLNDLELIQLISLGDAIPVDEQYYLKYRLKTFFAGWVASEAISAGRVDLIPSRFSRIPYLIASDAIRVDVAFIQVTPFDDSGFASLGVALDAARQAMDKADLVVGEINEEVPRTWGDTFVHADDFDFLIKSEDSPIYLDRWPVDDVFDKVAANVATLVEDGDCIGFTFGPLYEALGRHLSRKKDLGIHSLFFTDALMDLVESGAVTNRYKRVFRGKSLVSYAFGTKTLKKWLDQNPMVEFQGIDVVTNPLMVGQNKNYLAILPARKVDLTGNLTMHTGKGNVAASLGAASEIMAGAGISKGGKAIFALPSRNLKGESNIRVTVSDYPNQLNYSEFLDFVATEYGVAHLAGRSVRERALALIDIAHPDHRAELIAQAKAAHLIYKDQIYLTASGHLYPEELITSQVFKDGLQVRFRPIRPSDEEGMRRLFYRFSSEAVYYRFFSPIKSMPHSRMQEYVSVDYNRIMSIVGLVGEPGAGNIIAEARYAVIPDSRYADTAFVVDEAYQGKGIATYLLNMLIGIAQSKGMKGITADVLADNKSMWKVFEKAPYPLKARREPDSYHITIDFIEPENTCGLPL